MSDQLFKLTDNNFSFESHGVTISVQRFNLPGYIAFHVTFSSKRKPITIARANNSEGEKFWTAVPEGQNRENEARGVGKLIEEFLSTNK